MKVITLMIIVGTALTTTSVLADPICTKESKSKWLDITLAQQQISDMGYKIKKFKQTKTNCYELYGYDKEGNRVEIYFNPINMDKVKEEIDD